MRVEPAVLKGLSGHLLSTVLVLQSRLGDKPLVIRVVCPQIGTAVLLIKGFKAAFSVVSRELFEAKDPDEDCRCIPHPSMCPGVYTQNTPRERTCAG